MPATAARSGYNQSLSDTPTWDNVFISKDIDSTSAHGNALRGMHLIVGTAACEVEITGGLMNRSDGTIQVVTLPIGWNAPLYDFVKLNGRITKIRARSLTTGSVLSWVPVL